jgi:hypothetical protein
MPIQNPELAQEVEAWRQQLQTSLEQAKQLTNGVTDAQINWRPSADRWSIAECLDHLNQVAVRVVPEFEQELKAARRHLEANGPLWRPNWLERLFIRAVGPNPGFKVEVPKLYRPASESRANEVMDPFLDLHGRLLACIAQSRDADLSRIKVASPVTPLLRLRLGAWFSASAVHVAYHVEQAQAVRAHPAFPSNP